MAGGRGTAISRGGLACTPRPHGLRRAVDGGDERRERRGRRVLGGAQERSRGVVTVLRGEAEAVDRVAGEAFQ